MVLTTCSYIVMHYFIALEFNYQINLTFVFDNDLQ
jgi:hypothetical protein